MIDRNTVYMLDASKAVVAENGYRNQRILNNPVKGLLMLTNILFRLDNRYPKYRWKNIRSVKRMVKTYLIPLALRFLPPIFLRVKIFIALRPMATLRKNVDTIYIRYIGNIIGFESFIEAIIADIRDIVITGIPP